jgi:2-dehydro-3-deoxygluconokinase
MIEIPGGRVLAIGEAMLELAPAGERVYRQGFAGDTYNTIWHMAQLVGERSACGFVTRVGMDSFSDRFLSEMANDGLDTTAVVRDPDRQMGLYMIELDGVERSFHYWRKDSAARRLADDPPALAGALTGAALIHLSGITLAILTREARANLYAALAEARQKGAIVSFDPNVRPRLWTSPDETREAIIEMLGHADIAAPSFDDEATLWGDASPQATAERIAARGVREVVVKNGAMPVHALSGGQLHVIETPPVTGIRDTTGAGDAFNAGYLSGRLAGRDVPASIRLAQSVSAEVLQVSGALAPASRLKTLLGI